MRFVGSILLVWMLTVGSALAQSRGAQDVADEAGLYYRQALQAKDDFERGRFFFAAAEKLRAIRGEFPKSPIAAQIALGRYRDIDVARAEREGRAWRAANPSAALPGEAAALVPDFGGPKAPVPQFGGSGGALVPTFGANPGPAPTAKAASGGRLPRDEIVERLKNAVVMVFTQTKTTYGHGTGFFIAPNLVLTNTHVVEDATEVVILNRNIGFRVGSVLAKGKTPGGAGIDTAIIEVKNFSSPVHLPITTAFVEGDEIAIAGYTGKSMDFDASAEKMFRLLVSNVLPSIDDIPSMRFDFGILQGIYKDKDTLIENLQTGLTSGQGNSGSPLVNDCGQVVGQHYKGAKGMFKISQGVAYGETTRFSFAISARELVKFLAAARTPVVPVSERCR